MNERTYTMNDWRRDGTLQVRPGMYASIEVINELANSVPPTIWSNSTFQCGEPERYIRGLPVYHTFKRDGTGEWLYIGLCYEGETTPPVKNTTHTPPVKKAITEKPVIIKLYKPTMENLNKEYMIAVGREIGQAIKNLRECRGLTIEEAADVSQFKSSYLEKIERGLMPHNVHNITRIVEALGGRLAIIQEENESDPHCQFIELEDA